MTFLVVIGQSFGAVYGSATEIVGALEVAVQLREKMRLVYTNPV
jgi:hypothetical protein